MTYAFLDGWRQWRLSGPDRKPFLHGLVTNDVNGMARDRALFCCLLTPKGLMQGLLWVYDEADGLRLIAPPECAANVEGALRKVLPLSESKLTPIEGELYWTDGPGDLPFPALGSGGSLSFLRPSGEALGAEALERRRIEHALPRYGVDVDASTIPLEAGLEGAISYTKGCYMGQETISRIHHMGHVNRKLVKVRVKGADPRLKSVAGDLGLAMVRAEDAVPGKDLGFGVVL